MKHFISLKDWTKEELIEIVDKAIVIKSNPEKYFDILKGKTMIMLFEKTSTRTRLSFQTAMNQLGGQAIFLDKRTTQMSITDFKDEIQAIMRFGDILMFRAKQAKDVLEAASYNRIPVIDACSEKYHPAQALGDALTMLENSNSLDNIKKIAWLGIENNVSNSLKLICSKLNIEINIVSPETDKDSIDEELNKLSDNTDFVNKTTDLAEGLQNVNYVHTDTWMNMEFFENGEVKKEYAQEFQRRKDTFMPFQLNASLIDKYCPQAYIMHCMPCHVGYEITRDAIDHKNSLIYNQAENRLHIQKAIILKLLGKF